jgi:putative phosphoribosyl transferase
MAHAMFDDLESAGRQLAAVVTANEHSTVVLAIANSGVPVAIPVAEKLHAPLHAIVISRLFVRDSASPVCAVNVAGNLVVETESLARPAIEEQFVSDALQTLSRRVGEMRRDLPPYELLGRHAVLVDNAIHTGSTIKIAVAAVRRLRPLKVTVAIPVGEVLMKEEVERIADQVICVRWVKNFGHAGLWYKYFNRPDDERVKNLLLTVIGSQ